MPRQISPLMSVEARKKEILFTRAALRASPDAAALLPLTDGWLPANEALRAAIDQADEAECDADARRAVANAHLDAAVRAFGLDLAHAEAKRTPKPTRPTDTPHFKTFFHIPPSAFARLPLHEEIARVQSWLKVQEPALEPHRDALLRWAGLAAQALAATRDTAVLRGQAQVAREQTARDLTRGRDALEDALSPIARDKGYDRDWASSFFREDRADREPSAPSAAPPA